MEDHAPEHPTTPQAVVPPEHTEEATQPAREQIEERQREERRQRRDRERRQREQARPPEPVRVSPVDMHNAVDRKVQQILDGWIKRRERKGAPVRTVAIPIVSAIVGSGMSEQLFSHLNATTAHILPPFMGAMVTGAISPLASGIRRIAMGETAHTLFAKVLMRRGEGGLGTRLARGAESWGARKIMLRSDNTLQHLWSFLDEEGNVDVDRIESSTIGNQKTIKELIARGVYAKATINTIREIDASLSEADNDKVRRMDKAYEVAKILYEKKIPTIGQKENFLYDELEGMVNSMERRDWAKQAAWITGVGMAKSATLVGLADVITSQTVKNFGAGVKQFVTSLKPWVHKGASWLGTKFNQFAGFLGSFKPSWGLAPPPGPVVPPPTPAIPGGPLFLGGKGWVR